MFKIICDTDIPFFLSSLTPFHKIVHIQNRTNVCTLAVDFSSFYSLFTKHVITSIINISMLSTSQMLDRIYPFMALGAILKLPVPKKSPCRENLMFLIPARNSVR